MKCLPWRAVIVVTVLFICNFVSATSTTVVKNSLGNDKNESGDVKVGTNRQARDYTPPGQYMAPPIQSSYAAPVVDSYAAPAATSYAAPSTYGAPKGPIVMQGQYGAPAHYAIPPIVMGHSGGYGDYGGGYGGDDYGHSGSDYKELIGLLGLKGLKGLKGVKAAKAVKGLGLLALAPILLPLLPLLLPLLLLPLLLPLLLLLLIPVPVVTVPGRKKRSLQGRSIFEDTMTSLVSNLPPSITSVPPAQLSACLDTFVCQTGELVQRSAPSLIQPASWLLTSLWPPEMHHKVKIFQNSSRCNEKYKCKVKQLEYLFNNVVRRESVKLKHRINEKIGERKRVGWSDLMRIIFE